MLKEGINLPKFLLQNTHMYIYVYKVCMYTNTLFIGQDSASLSHTEERPDSTIDSMFVLCRHTGILEGICMEMP